MTKNNSHDYLMSRALELARGGLGRVWPNPSVGCVIVKDGRVVGEGRTGDGGRPHAEEIALQQAGDAARGADVYVTLEPCCHERTGGSCTEKLIDAGVGQVFVACMDVDPRTEGHGIARLAEAGIEVQTGVCEAEAVELQRGFFLKMREGRPFITLKTATSADGKIAGGAQRWITGEEARHHGHVFRSCHDAILVGVGTALADDPLLSTRLDGVHHDIVRIVLDTNLRLPAESKLVQSAQYLPLWVLYKDDPEGRAAELEKLGVRLFPVEGRDVRAAVRLLAKEGITRLMVEGGAQVHTSFLEAGLYDEVAWFFAPKTVIGAEGLPALRGYDILTLAEDFPLVLKDERELGEDRLRIYVRED